MNAENESRHDANFVVTGDNGNRHNGNLLRRQWRKS